MTESGHAVHATNVSSLRQARLARVGNTLRRIGPRPTLLTRYLAHRALQEVRRRRLRRTYSVRVAQVPPGAVLRSWPIDLVTLGEIPAELRTAATALVREAQLILSGSVDILGSGPTDLGAAVDWHRDFKSSHRWPLDFFLDLEVTRLTDASDAKVPWDLSRSHHLLTLARACRLTGEARYGAEVERLLGSWLDANPTGYGINWAQPMEVAIRAVNWIWILRTLDGAYALSPSLERRLVESLQAHGRHIAGTLEGTPLLRSNHYLADVLGLLVLGATIEGDPAARRWLRVGRRAMEREILAQVRSDGLSFEASTAYHGLVLEMFVLARFVAAWRGMPLSRRYDDRLRRMLAASRSLRHPDGTMPLLGDVDSGRILPGAFARRPSHDAHLALGAAALGSARLVEGFPDPEVAWTLGVDAWRALSERPIETPSWSRAFPASGVYVLERSPFRAVLRCGDVGQNGNGGHAHNDLCAYELYAGGLVAVDPGTYAYTGNPAARNAYRSVAAHNTIMVDAAEPNPFPPELFRLPQNATPTLVDWRPDVPAVTVEHDGYRALPGAPRHRRSATVDPDGFVVDDLVDGSGTHEVRCTVQLAPGVHATKVGPRLLRLVTATDEFALEFVGDVVVAVEDGSVAREYGVQEPAPRVTATTTAPLPVSLTHRFTWTRKGAGA